MSVKINRAGQRIHPLCALRKVQAGVRAYYRHRGSLIWERPNSGGAQAGSVLSIGTFWRGAASIYYESRVAKLGLHQSELPKIDEEFEAIIEGEELTRKEKLKTKWAALEALVGNPKRIDLVAADLVQHYERRVEAMEGRATVCASEGRKGPRISGNARQF